MSQTGELLCNKSFKAANQKTFLVESVQYFISTQTFLKQSVGVVARFNGFTK